MNSLQVRTAVHDHLLHAHAARVRVEVGQDEAPRTGGQDAGGVVREGCPVRATLDIRFVPELFPNRLTSF